MYDSENFSLVTRIEAGAGVNVVHSTNLEGENIWTASVDETWLINWVNANSAGSLKLNDSDEARIRVLESKLGLTTTTTVTTAAPAVIPAGTTGTTEVTVTGDVATLSDTITMTYNLTDAGGDNLVSETLVGSAGASPTHVLMAIYSQMRRNNGMLLFMTPTFDFTNGKLILTWKDANVGSTFTYSIASQAAGDNIVFTASDY